MNRTAYDPALGRRRHRATPARSKPKGRALGAPLVLVLLFVGMVFVDLSREGGGGGDASVLPESVVGTWTTRDPRYAGRSIHIDAELVVIRRGEDEPAAVGVVTAVQSRDEDGRHVVRVDYRTDEGTFSVDLMPQEGGIRLRNPADVLWTRG